MPQLIFGERGEYLENIRSLFVRRVPAFLVLSLSWFIKKIEKALGVLFFIQVPDTLAPLSFSEWEDIKILETLKERGVVKVYYKDHLSAYPDEPRLKSWSVTLVGEETYRGLGGYGYDFFSHKEAIGPAAGEAYERFALNTFLPEEKNIRTASYTELQKEGALDIFSVAGYTDTFRKQNHPHFSLTFTKNTSFQWVRGKSLISGRPLWVPLQLVSFLGQHRTHNKKEPLIMKIISTGGAAHKKEKDAIFNGLLEVIQRDAFMIYWVRNITPEIIDTASIPSEKLRFIEKQFKRYNLLFFTLYLKTDVPVHTVATVIIDETGIGPAVCVGAATGFDLADVVYKSILETFASRLGVRKLMNFHIASGKTLSFNEKTLGHEERLLYWCAKEHIKDIQFFITGKKVQMETLPVFNPNEDKLEYLRQFFKKEEKEVAVVPLISEKTPKDMPLTAVMVTVPEFQPLHLEEIFPCFGGTRLEEVPAQLGLSTQKEINTIPHPFP